VKLVFAILSIATVYVLYLLGNILFGKKTSIFVAFIAAINPWGIFLGRTAYEMVPETFLYLLGIYALIKLKGNRIYWSIPILTLAFYSHIATKIVFFPIIVTLLFFLYFENKKKYLKQYLVVGLFAFLLFLFFAVSLKLNPTLSRTSELINPNDPKIIETVNSTRKLTIDSKLNYIATNKLTALTNVLISKTFRTLSPEYLFLNGDQFYSLYTHGFFYIADSIFIFLGMLYAISKNKKKFLLLISLSFLAIVPHLVHTLSLDNFVPQIALLFPFLILFCGYGITYLYETFNKKLVLVFVVIIYIVSLFNFLNIYLYQFPLKETFDFKLRVISQYVKLTGSNEKINIYSNRSSDYFKKFLFYSDGINNNNVNEVIKTFKNRKFSLNNVTFTDCNFPDLTKNVSIIDLDCAVSDNGLTHISTARLIDGGATFKIYNDSVCKNENIGTYATNIKLSGFSVENITKEKFCKTYLVK
jgi:uncharacterized membrane protein